MMPYSRRRCVTPYGEGDDERAGEECDGDHELEWHAVHARVAIDSAVVRKSAVVECVQPLSAQSLRSGRRGVSASRITVASLVPSNRPAVS